MERRHSSHLVQQTVHRAHQVDLHQSRQHADALRVLLQTRRHIDQTRDRGERERDVQLVENQAQEVVVRRQVPALIVVLHVTLVRFLDRLRHVRGRVRAGEVVRAVHFFLAHRRFLAVLIRSRYGVQFQGRLVRAAILLGVVRSGVEKAGQFTQVVVRLFVRAEEEHNRIEQQRLTSRTKKRLTLPHDDFGSVAIDWHSKYQNEIKSL